MRRALQFSMSPRKRRKRNRSLSFFRYHVDKKVNISRECRSDGRSMKSLRVVLGFCFYWGFLSGQHVKEVKAELPDYCSQFFAVSFNWLTSCFASTRPVLNSWLCSWLNEIMVSSQVIGVIGHLCERHFAQRQWVVDLVSRFLVNSCPSKISNALPCWVSP